MVLTPSTMLPLGTRAPDFTLSDAHGNSHSLSECIGEKATLIAFICNHCPYVKHLKPDLAQLAREYAAQGVATIAINSNDIANYPDDSPEKMREDIEEFGYNFPYLLDETQEVAKAYRAACTPDFYIFDKDLKLAYRGQFDDSRPGNDIPVTGADIRKALDTIVAGDSLDEDQTASIGCNIKWKAGNAPDYFG